MEARPPNAYFGFKRIFLFKRLGIPSSMSRLTNGSYGSSKLSETSDKTSLGYL
jgi:hypothetical protein